MEATHDTPFVADLMPILDVDGLEARVAVLKATFSISGGGTVPADDQEPLCAVDEYIGEPHSSSTLRESDGAYFKPVTDVVVAGSVYAPYGMPATSFNVSLRVGEIAKPVKVFGDRQWSYGPLTGAHVSDPVPVAEVPICWERAFGGVDTKTAASDQPAWEVRNPIGTGFCANKSVDGLDGLRLPNFEDPPRLIRSWNDRPEPCGLGFVGRSWSPRIRFAGTYDESWQKTRMPILPLDFDYRYFNAAAPGLTYPGYLTGGEMVTAENLAPCGWQQFSLPKLEVIFRGTARNRRFEVEGRLDTVVLQLDRNRVILTFRAKYAVLMNEAADSVHVKVRYS